MIGSLKGKIFYLYAVLGNADLALDQLSPHAPARSNIQDIEKAAKRAAELAKQMLAYSGKGQFVIEVIDLNELLTDMAQLLAASISKKATLRLNLAKDIGEDLFFRI